MQKEVADFLKQIESGGKAVFFLIGRNGATSLLGETTIDFAKKMRDNPPPGFSDTRLIVKSPFGGLEI